MRNGVTTAYHWLALLIAACIVVQVFLAGLGVFGAESFDAHEGFGWMIHTAAILLFILALIGPRTGRAIGISFGLLALMTVQIMLVGARDDTPWVAAFHPTLALFVLGLAIYIGRPAISRPRAASAPRPAR
jgi:phosphoglycerol transferase MdoB-like AlkP superfamily enzyme